MLKSLHVENFKAIPYLETSDLMKSHGGVLKFSQKKPNVIVGPNGAGKTALLDALAIRNLAYFHGVSTLDQKYVMSGESDAWWTKPTSWSNDHMFLEGLHCESDHAPLLYYRPGHIPGNERCITTAMMTGYFDEAKAYARATEKKSSGQACQAMLNKILAALNGKGLPTDYATANWRYGVKAIDLDKTRSMGHHSWDYKAERLKMFLDMIPPAPDMVERQSKKSKAGAPKMAKIPVIVMDEPEQSLDAMSEAQLWQAISNVDCNRSQVIVATHSVFPILNPTKFNLIEAHPGFARDVRACYGL